MVLKKMGVERNMRILLVGESGVGKTSLILSLVTEEFQEDVPPKVEEITIPADVIPDEVPTQIVDYSSIEQTDEQLTEEIQRANVICVVYSIDNDESFEKVTTKWLPFIRKNLLEDKKCPVILVGNKVDLVDYTTIGAMIDIMENYSEVESCVECSAKTLKNITEIFYYAQKAVLHPTSPLYSMESQDLTPECKRALTRVFKICDLDNDGLLNDSELNFFQRICFNISPQSGILEDVKSAIRRNSCNGLEKNCITLQGFLLLHCLFIQKGRNETIWTVLRKFGYDEKLNMSQEYLHPQIIVPPGCTTELSYQGQQFFTSLFEKHDKDKDGALCPAELSSLFATCPCPAWGNEVHNTVPCTKKDKWITLKGFLCQWMLITLFDVTKTLEYLAYFGYNIQEGGNQLSAVHVTREKKLDLAKRQTSRNVYRCLVVGSKECGKSMFCLRLLGHSVEEMFNAVKKKGKEPLCTINVIPVYGQEKYLVLEDIEVKNAPAALSVVQCDVICLLYNVEDPNSFEFIAKLYLECLTETKTPTLVVETKGDLSSVKQNYIMQPEIFCSRHRLPPPQSVSVFGDIPIRVYEELATMASFPQLEKPGFLHIDTHVLWQAGITFATATVIGFLIMKIMKLDV